MIFSVKSRSLFSEIFWSVGERYSTWQKHEVRSNYDGNSAESDETLALEDCLHNLSPCKSVDNDNLPSLIITPSLGSLPHADVPAERLEVPG